MRWEIGALPRNFFSIPLSIRNHFFIDLRQLIFQLLNTLRVGTRQSVTNRETRNYLLLRQPSLDAF